MFEIIKWVFTLMTLELARENVANKFSSSPPEPNKVVQHVEVNSSYKQEKLSVPLKHTYQGVLKYYIIVFKDIDRDWYYTSYGLLGPDGKMKPHQHTVQCHGGSKRAPVVFVFKDEKDKDQFFASNGHCPLEVVKNNPCACFYDYILKYIK